MWLGAEDREAWRLLEEAALLSPENNRQATAGCFVSGKRNYLKPKKARSWHWIGCKTLTMAYFWPTINLPSHHLCQGYFTCQHIVTSARRVPVGHILCKSSTSTSPTTSPWTALSSQPYTARNCSLCHLEPELSHLCGRRLPTNHLHEPSEFPLPSA